MMSKERKARVDTEKLGKLMGIYSYVNAVIFFIIGLSYRFDFKILITPLIVFFAIWTIYIMIKAQKCDGNIFDENGKLRRGAGKQLVMPIGITVAAFILVGFLMYFSVQPTEISFTVEGLQIHGMYGEVYGWDSIKNIKLIEDIPNIELRTNGSALGKKLKGYFRTTELGTVKMFVDMENPPFIYFEGNNKIVIFNMQDADKTNEVYQEIVRITN